MLSAIVGINWGDEGKGRMVDLLSQDYDVVVRYQGGNNAGHTVINHLGKFILNLMPSGILRPEVVNVMGNGMVIDLEHLHKEMGKLVPGRCADHTGKLKNLRPRHHLPALPCDAGLSGGGPAGRREIRLHPQRNCSGVRR